MTRETQENPPFSSKRLRKAGPAERREILDALASDHSPGTPESARRLDPASPDTLEFASVMVENAYGLMGIPLGIVPSLKVDGREYPVPLASEEPSVVAAASYAAGLAGMHGGVITDIDPPVMKGHVYILFPAPDGVGGSRLVRENQDPARRALAALEAARPRLTGILETGLQSMTARGGGLRGLTFGVLPEKPDTVKVEFLVDVRDAMGANLINTCAESLRVPLEEASGGQVILAILSNNADLRLCRASLRIPVAELRSGSWSGFALAERMAQASLVAQADPDRAVTHNKGIMNGISALALGTGNDTRALEAAVHTWACRSGSCRGLSTFRVEDGFLVGRLELPLALGTVGGASGCHPVSRYNLALMGNPGGSGLCRIAAALGLVQNLAALMALAGEGIQAGHMRLHQRRLDWLASRGTKEGS